MSACDSSSLAVARQSSSIPSDDMTLRRYGRWLVLGFSGRDKFGFDRWSARCDCGTERTVGGAALRSGASTSCGCKQRESATKHGMHKTPEFRTWLQIIDRCENPKCKSFGKYGGRGIAVCNRWRDSFEAFISDMGRRPSSAHSIDRVDNSKGYSPENCRWATRSEQGRNKRNNSTLTLNGETRCIAEWVELTGISRDAIRGRLKLGWSVERALTTPMSPRKDKAA